MLTALFLASLLGSPSPSPSPAPAPTLSPLAIYDRSMAVMRALPRPHSANYHAVMSISGVTMKCSSTGLDFNGLSRDTSTYVYEAHFEAPDKTSAIGTIDGKTCKGDDVLPPFIDFNDEHKPKPSASPSDESGGLSVIASVRSVSHDYDVFLRGLEDYGGHQVYHLELRARHDPEENPLTSMLVDTQNYRIRSMTADVHVTEFVVGARAHIVIGFVDSGTYYVADNMKVALSLAAMVFFRKHIGLSIQDSNYTFDDAK